MWKIKDTFMSNKRNLVDRVLEQKGGIDEQRFSSTTWAENGVVIKNVYTTDSIVILNHFSENRDLLH